MNRINAFSLIELMVVIAIVALLSAVAVPSYNNYIIRGKVVNAIQAVESLRTKAMQFYSTNGTFTGMTFDYLCSGTIVNSGTACDASNVSNVSAIGMTIAPDGTAMRFNILFVDGFAGHNVGGVTVPRLFVGLKEENGVLNVACGYRSDNTSLALDPDYLPESCNTDIFTFVGA